MAYRSVQTHFWTDPAVRSLSPEGKLLFIYLITNPHTHVSGLYYLPPTTIALETGLPQKTIDTLLDRVSSVEIDRECCLIWVKKMFEYQAQGEKAQRAAANHLATLHNSFLIKDFITFYPNIKQYCQDTLLDRVSDRSTRFGLLKEDTILKEDTTLKEEEEQKNKNLVLRKPKRPHQDLSTSKTTQTWESYKVAYEARYQTEPVRNAQVNGMISRLVDRLGIEAAPAVAGFYVQHNKQFYVEKRHPVNLLLADAEGLHTQWITGVKATSREAQSAEQKDNVVEQYKRIIGRNGGAA